MLEATDQLRCEVLRHGGAAAVSTDKNRLATFDRPGDGLSDLNDEGFLLLEPPVQRPSFPEEIAQPWFLFP